MKYCLAKRFLLCILVLSCFLAHGERRAYQVIATKSDTVNSFYYDGKTELNLKGKWKFYWKQLIESGDVRLNNSNAPFVKLPAYWKNHGLSGEPLPKFGYATYKTNIISSSDYDIGLEYAVPHVAERIYLNGKLIVETGVIAREAENETGLWLPGTAICKLKAGNNELIWQLSNHTHARGGAFKVPAIGPVKEMISLRESQLIMNAFIIGGLFFIGLFFIGMYALWRRDLQFLYYGLYAIFFGYWLSNYGLHIFKPLVGVLDFTLTARLIYVSFYGGFLFFLLFMYETYKATFSKRFVQVSSVVYIVFILSAIITSPHIFTSLIVILQAYSFLLLFYTLYIIFKAIRRREKGSVLMFLGVFLFALAKVSMLGSFNNVILRIDSFNSILYFSTYIVFSFVLAQKIGLAFNEVFRLQQETKVQRDEISSQAEKLSRLDKFKSRFFANVSHDLRTPLTLIKGHIFQLKSEENYLNTQSLESLAILEKNSDKLVQLTDEIKDIILLEDEKLTLHYQKVQIEDHLQTLVNLFDSSANLKGIDLRFTSAMKERLSMNLDPLQFEKIIYNLLSNALKFTPKGGYIEVALSAEGENVLISVSDNGAGISSENVEYIFTRYYQASENIHYSKEGVGIGLALVLELVKLHEGNIRVESELGKGARFEIVLPFNLDKITAEESPEEVFELTKKGLLLDKEPAGEPYHSIEQKELPQKEGLKTILIVDDHPDIRNYIRTLLEDSFNILQAGDGKAALTVLKQEKVDLVITDLMMPWLDGHGLIEEMNKEERFKNIPVLVVSARTAAEDKIKVLEKGVNDFIAKPFLPDELKLRVINAIEKQQTGGNVWDALAKDKKKFNAIEKNVINRINDLIISRIDDPKLSVQHIADELIYSRRNAFNIVKELTKMSPKDYIKQVRFKYAMDLLKKKKVSSVTEAAQAIGMTNTTYFSRQFEAIMKVHPSELLK